MSLRIKYALLVILQKYSPLGRQGLHESTKFKFYNYDLK